MVALTQVLLKLHSFLREKFVYPCICRWARWQPLYYNHPLALPVFCLFMELHRGHRVWWTTGVKSGAICEVLKASFFGLAGIHGMAAKCGSIYSVLLTIAQERTPHGTAVYKYFHHCSCRFSCCGILVWCILMDQNTLVYTLLQHQWAHVKTMPAFAICLLMREALQPQTHAQHLFHKHPPWFLLPF